jgi:hypothetical protein
LACDRRLRRRVRETRYDDNATSLLIRITRHDGKPRVTRLRACPHERC